MRRTARPDTDARRRPDRLRGLCSAPASSGVAASASVRSQKNIRRAAVLARVLNPGLQSPAASAAGTASAHHARPVRAVPAATCIGSGNLWNGSWAAEPERVCHGSVRSGPGDALCCLEKIKQICAKVAAGDFGEQLAVYRRSIHSSGSGTVSVCMCMCAAGAHRSV